MADHSPATAKYTTSHGLSNQQIKRYSRQLLLRDIGVQGQEKLCNSSVLIIGAGGIGSPAILYLAAAGVGNLGIVDYDFVEESNLQRQIIHSEASINTSKTDSAATAVRSISSLVQCTTYNTLIDQSNVLEIVSGYDVVVDGSDNVATRYLLNDACVLLGKPLVSGSALRMDGQLTVYNHQGGPCYRCIFPVPPPPETVSNCNDGGVLGVVPGIIGCMQALEVIKLISGIQTSYSQKMLLLDAVSGSFRTVKLRGKSSTCAVCGPNPTITKPIDYVQFCGASPHDKALNLDVACPKDRISVKDYQNVMMAGKPHILLDVREKVQFDICSLPQSHNVSFGQLERQLDSIIKLRHDVVMETKTEDVPIYVVCRLGNDSQLAVQKLKENGVTNVFDIVGGLASWTKEIDPIFPEY
ncbi:hypothetical protein BATDEDRAFT_8411 [Batrachochytrium dendrobatidis JAM81]|uniref:Rhodanese domain-containing protein n=1 Tax=Batrachochytrium dendrobatidis (strain JAM81 / FGSC 10211) TaxID=684364 RepID=F4NU54_BATDJ|nr:uncharacterized protein BATDEDRAFT_8411 [Batrachochytrium dendrobatidis JAM81]EGF84382.1 hypothetical protein BATDEDRAFT_8411 [Batrachochytrium dendrobatidis JAM81]KAJ8327254.1 hypothetical protein O5D80_004661 [Batrachochytrium dendrobatidis]KAK5667844.1 hypothetical protein QVD99_004894 [Batrachochytrium dendrobatidis]|eukprot:XP_006675000.1 hypothetical protein BATDEDRAFT_8411 [Batrachochytrium dendrobatidis JAM81]